MQKVRGAAWAGVVVAGVLGLGACTGDDPVPPVTSSAPTSTSSPTNSEPTIAAPTLPVEASQETDVGAVAFVRHYFTLANHGFATGSAAELDALGDPTCDGCASLVDAITTSTADGSRFEGDAYVLSAVNSPKPDGGVVVVSVVYAQPSMTRIAPDGSREPTDSVEEQRVRLRLRWATTSWMVEGLGA